VAKKDKCYDLTTVGGRIKYCRDRAKLTQESFAKDIFATRQLVAAWENGNRDSYIGYLPKICEVLHCDESFILNGVDEKNQTVASSLGLTNDSINFLKTVKSNDYYVPFVSTDSDEFDATSVYDVLMFKNDRDIPVEVEGGYPDEILLAVNSLLSYSNGQQLIAMIAKFLLIDFGQASVNGEYCYSLEYNTNSEKRKKTAISTAFMKNALLSAISSKLEDLKDDMRKGGY